MRYSSTMDTNDTRIARIRAIAQNSGLSDEEKTRQMQDVYSPRSNCIATTKGCSANTSEKIEFVMEAPREGHCERVHVDLGLLRSCKHYKRGCSIVSNCCGNIFPCRLCHDEALENDHLIDRFATTQIVCRSCGLIQGIAERCADPNCTGFTSSKYFCSKCVLWNDDAVMAANTIHCDDCGMCRIIEDDGDNIPIEKRIKHCQTCCLCFPLNSYEGHTCVNAMQDCCICGEQLHNSVHGVRPLRCGHGLHSTCMSSAIRNGIMACPLCRKSFHEPNEKDAKYYASVLTAYEMPPELRHYIATVQCNDCNSTGETSFHFMGNSCPNCASWNTIIVAKHKDPKFWLDDATMPSDYVESGDMEDGQGAIQGGSDQAETFEDEDGQTRTGVDDS